MSIKNRIEKLEIKHSPSTYWVILPHFDNVDGKRMVLNIKTQERITKEEFDKLDISDNDIIDIQIEFV